MSNHENVLVQANLKTPRQGLLNAYGYDEQSFDLALAILEDRIARIVALEGQVWGAGNAAASLELAPAAQQPPAIAAAPAAPAALPAAQPAPGGWPEAAPAPSFTQAATPMCSHGPRQARSGQSAKGPWKAYFCPTDKGTPGQCSPMFVDRKSPEWNVFPA